MPGHHVNGTTLWVAERGSTSEKNLPTLVLVHGFPLDSRMWAAQLQALSDHARVIAPDLRGFGQSKSEGPFTIESLADDLHALLAEMNALPCVLAGLSMGGYVALAFAKKYAADLRGLILVDTKAEADTAEQKQGRQKMIDTARSPAGAAAVAEQMLPKMLAKDAATRRPGQAQELRRIMEGCPPKTIENALAAMRDRPDRSGELASIRVPTLILVGDGDQITPPAVAETMAKAIPGAQLAVVHGAGHMAPLEQPEQVNRAIRQFLERLPA